MRIKFLTVNILHGGEVWEPLVEFLKKESADIVVMQEVNNSPDKTLGKNYRTVSEFRKILNYKYDSFGQNVIVSLKLEDIDQGNFILSRFPLVNQKIVFFDVPYGKFDHRDTQDFRLFPASMQNVSVQLKNKTINLYNVHGIWDFHGEDNKRRLEMSKKIISEIKNKENIILAGDFNVKYETKTIVNIEKYLNNFFKGELKTTFNMKRKTNPGFAVSAVDMIFVSPDIKVISHSCPNVDISDHLPLIAEFEI